jgi:pimeloyl-ACP methyl ester carboxylesterase
MRYHGAKPERRRVWARLTGSRCRNDPSGGEELEMAKRDLEDIVVLLPGIVGSVLQKDGKDLWALSGQAFWQLIRSLGRSLQDLKLEGDDPELDDLGDGIRATRLMQDVHMIPGLVKIDGYTGVVRMIHDTFKVEQGSLEDDKLANFFEFPYDWRRDNRVAARQLKRLVDDKLHRWRKETPYKDAKVILVAHSMGGLVSRHYLEVLGGWRDCKALITFGTPYRGSLNALNFLANGFKQLFIDLSEVLRSLTSVYQLLPIYRVLEVDGEHQRIAETDDVPGVSKELAAQALAFHRAIEDAVNEHQKDNDYLRSFRILPIVGTRQPTLQSAVLTGGKVTVYRELPPWIDARLSDGDGTVPRVSAIPIELSDAWRDTFLAERHASLQNNATILDDLRERLVQMQVRDLGEVRGAMPVRGGENLPAISLELEDLYLRHEPVTLRAGLVNADPDEVGGLRARIESASNGRAALEGEFVKADGEWTLTASELPAGVYRVRVHTSQSGFGTPTPVHDVFEVADF